MLNLVIFGPPGAGKGTQSENLIHKYGLIHLSTGDILREEVKNQTELGKKAKQLMDTGKLVPDEIVIGMIHRKIDENKQAPGFLFDGFPRTVAQAVALDEMLNHKLMKIDKLIALEVSEEELVKRILKRGKTSGRTDDTDLSKIKTRVQEYEEKTKPVMEYYKKQGKFRSVSGLGEIEQIFQGICKAVEV
ncbi:MAG: adenylate kinase [Bacteroidetes bacterium RIFCSPLOWO2_02_FULL_36_8]|nr:MAG: adenylate kinase [Bacteroidetes bacterium RIFCSPLOWO2_02_FULL_36_8]OFY69661.1 MAG: adenylate kinase [Bacteroidetes bacterium RIFCSPLOWO2_12_FULL_37_12]